LILFAFSCFAPLSKQRFSSWHKKNKCCNIKSYNVYLRLDKCNKKNCFIFQNIFFHLYSEVLLCNVYLAAFLP
jgi:hypothetical protein